MLSLLNWPTELGAEISWKEHPNSMQYFQIATNSCANSAILIVILSLLLLENRQERMNL